MGRVSEQASEIALLPSSAPLPSILAPYILKGQKIPTTSTNEHKF